MNELFEEQFHKSAKREKKFRNAIRIAVVLLFLILIITTAAMVYLRKAMITDWKEFDADKNAKIEKIFSIRLDEKVELKHYHKNNRQYQLWFEYSGEYTDFVRNNIQGSECHISEYDEKNGCDKQLGYDKDSDEKPVAAGDYITKDDSHTEKYKIAFYSEGENRLRGKIYCAD